MTLTAALPRLETQRLTLRALTGADFPAFADYAASPRTGFVGGPSDRARAFEKFAAMIGHWTLPGFGRYALCLKSDDNAIGHAGHMQMTDNTPPEITWTLWDAQHQGHGYATGASTRILSHLLVGLSWPILIGRISRDNAASIALARRLGGKHDQSAEAPAWFPDAVTYRFDRQETKQ